jgi:hypothetical protein
MEMDDEGLHEREIFFHHSHLSEEYSPGLLTLTSNVFEFNVVPSTVKEGDVMATNIKLAEKDIIT